jgi:hypothetical protein
MRQALHIFKKDFRGSAYEIAVMLAVVAMFAYVESMGKYAVSSMSEILQLLLIVSWWYLTALVIHAEAIPGDRQFWLTRPYSWKSLLVAKIILLILIVGPPMAIADAIILHAQGFPVWSNAGGILREMVQRLETFLLPAIVFACLTRSLGGFIASSLGTLVALVAYFSVSFWNGRELSIWDGAFWLSVAMDAALIPAVILLQYARRKRLAMGGAICALILPLVVMRVPQPLRFPAMLMQPRAGEPGLRFSLAESPGLSSISARDANIELPIHVEGIQGLDLRAKNIEVILQMHDGKLFRGIHAGLVRDNSDPVIFLERFAVPEEIRSEMVQIYTLLELTLYRTVNSTPIETGEFAIPGVGYCRSFAVNLFCRSALHMPDRLFSIHRANGEILESPNPSINGLSMSPVVSFNLQTASDATNILAGEPVNHLTRDFYLRDVNLAQYTITRKGVWWWCRRW